MEPSVFSIRRHGTPRQPRSPANARPTGPAPTMSTGTLFLLVITVLGSPRPGNAHCRNRGKHGEPGDNCLRFVATHVIGNRYRSGRRPRWYRIEANTNLCESDCGDRFL